MFRMEYRTSNTGVPILKKKDIDNYASNFLFDYNKSLLKKAQVVPIEDIIENYLRLDIDYKCLDKDGSTLGLTSFTNGWLQVYNPETDSEESITVTKGTIIIDSRLLDDALEGRLRFTFGHETSHWLLHRKKYEKDERQAVLFGSDAEIETIKCLNRNIENIWNFPKDKLLTDEDWLEWQADYMAGALLLPTEPFCREFFGLLSKLNLHHGYLFLDDQPCNKSNFKTVSTELSHLFSVSKKAVQVRLAKLNLLRTPQKQIQFLAN